MQTAKKPSSKPEVTNFWYIDYDRESVEERRFIDINFGKYIKIVVTDPNFKHFEATALQKKATWDSTCNAIFNILDLLNNFFDPDELDNRMVYVQNTYKKQVSGRFRLWIDCQRLYCLTFFNLLQEVSEFNLNRSIMCMSRIKKALVTLFSCYSYQMFNEKEFTRFLFTFKQLIMSLQKTFMKDNLLCIGFTTDYLLLLGNVSKNQKVSENEFENELFQKTCKDIFKVSEIHAISIEQKLLKLQRQVEARKRFTKFNEWGSGSTGLHVADSVKNSYDPEYLEMMEKLKREEELKNVSKRALQDIIAKEKFDRSMNSYEKKEKTSMRNKFNLHKTLQRTENYPYKQTNTFFNNFIDGVAIVQQQNITQKKMVVEDSDLESEMEFIYYDPSYQSMAKTAPKDFARVKEEDLVDFDDNIEKEWQQMEAENKITGIFWKNVRQPGAGDPYSQEDDERDYAPDIPFEKSGYESGDEENEGEVSSRANREYFEEFMCSVKQRRYHNCYRSRGTPAIRLNIYKEKHEDEQKKWGIVRSLFKELKVNKNLDKLVTLMPTYTYIKRQRVPDRLAVIG